MAIDDTDNIGEPIDTIYKIDRKKGKITIVKCEENPPDKCDEISEEECEEGSEKYDEAMKEIKNIEEAEEDISEHK